MDNPFSLIGKQVLVTGASSGIGSRTAIECSQAGADVILMGRDRGRLENTFSQLKPGNHAQVIADLSDIPALDSQIGELLQTKGPVQGFVHAAGIEYTAPFPLTRIHHYEELFRINVLAGLDLARILSQKKFLKPDAGGSFVFISSIRALHGQEGAVAYAASKGALISAIRSLALEMVIKKIRVNSLSPAIVLTPMIDKLFNSLTVDQTDSMKRQHPLGFGEPKDVALACVYLLSDASRWITGQNLVIDGGFSVR